MIFLRGIDLLLIVSVNKEHSNWSYLVAAKQSFAQSSATTLVDTAVLISLMSLAILSRKWVASRMICRIEDRA